MQQIKVICANFTFKLSKHCSPSDVFISVSKLFDLSNSAYKPNGILAKHSNFIMCIFDLKCLARCPCILNAMLQSEHLNGRGSDDDSVGDEDNYKN